MRTGKLIDVKDDINLEQQACPLLKVWRTHLVGFTSFLQTIQKWPLLVYDVDPILVSPSLLVGSPLKVMNPQALTNKVRAHQKSWAKTGGGLTDLE